MKSIKDYISETEKISPINNYILEAEEDNESEENNDENDSEEKTTQRGNIKFVIWEEPDKKVSWLKDNNKYQKIEYKHEDKEKKLFIDFLLGYVKEENTWKLWIGKIGAISYDDDPYCDFETESFATAIVKALDKVEEFIKEVEEEPENWIQYYKDI